MIDGQTGTGNSLVEFMTSRLLWLTIGIIFAGVLLGAILVDVIGEWTYAIGFIAGSWTNELANIAEELWGGEE